MTNEQDVRSWFETEVKERMEDAGLKPYHISSMCKIEHGRIYGYLKGSPFPRVWKIILLAELLNCSVNDLLGYEEVDDLNVYETFLASETYLDEDEFATRFSKRLVRVMDETFTTPEELHKETGIPLTNIEYWVGNNPDSLPSVSQLIRICDALDCTPTDLLGY